MIPSILWELILPVWLHLFTHSNTQCSALRSPTTKKQYQPNKLAESEARIDFDKDTQKPDIAWERLKETNPVRAIHLDSVSQLQPPPKNHLRFVCLSDTHAQVERKVEFLKNIPPGDVLIHSGDFTMAGAPEEVMAFNQFLSNLPHPVKLVIAGNHEITFESAAGYAGGVHPTLARKALGLPMSAKDIEVEEACKGCLTSAIYLQDQTVEICGIKIYCSPWVPVYGTWGFSLPRGYSLLRQWNKIPTDTDILVTHGPPLGYGDSYREGKHAGCAELLNTVVMRVKPKFHVFGHIHNGYGKFTNEETVFINASVCDNRYRIKNEPVVFDMPLPSGFTLEDFQKVSMSSLREKLNLASGIRGCQAKQKGQKSEEKCASAAGCDSVDDSTQERSNGASNHDNLETKLANVHV